MDGSLDEPMSRYVVDLSVTYINATQVLVISSDTFSFLLQLLQLYLALVQVCAEIFSLEIR